MIMVAMIVIVVVFVGGWIATHYFLKAKGQSGLVSLGGGFLIACVLAIVAAYATRPLVSPATSDAQASESTAGQTIVPRRKRRPYHAEFNALDARGREMTELLATKLGCDRSDLGRYVDHQYGTISFDQEYGNRTATLEKPLPAIHGVLEYTCWDTRSARKTKQYAQIILGLDKEFGVWRCPGIDPITTFDVSGNVSTGYEIDGGQVANLRVVCQFEEERFEAEAR